jgi:hypothetical protein
MNDNAKSKEGDASMPEIDHEWTNDAVCPYCGYADKESWELDGEDGQEGETTCGSCERDFIYYRNVSVTFTTMKIEDKRKRGI